MNLRIVNQQLSLETPVGWLDLRLKRSSDSSTLVSAVTPFLTFSLVYH